MARAQALLVRTAYPGFLLQFDRNVSPKRIQHPLLRKKRIINPPNKELASKAEEAPVLNCGGTSARVS